MNNYINYSYENNTIKYECNWDNPENIKIYNYLSKLFSQYIDEGVLESIYSESVVNGFYEDDLLAVVGLPIHYNKLFTEEGLDNVMSYKLPEFSISNESYQIGSFITSKSYVVASSSNNKKTAHHFANFLISGEVQKLRYDMTGSIPASKSLLTSPSFTDKLTDVEKAYIEQSNYAINQSTQIENSFYEIMDDICFALFNDNLLSNKTISELLIESVALLIQ
jgi:ABC-type glycerol-3-phosphate transport system substrate-binding protein